jgi:hypothetical protein
MPRPVSFIRRSEKGLHSSICLCCFRSAGRSPYASVLTVYEMIHECRPSDLSGQTVDPVETCSDQFPTIELLSPVTFQSNPYA